MGEQLKKILISHVMPGKKVKMKLTNVEFRKTDKVFRKACKLAGVPATTRQASKYRNGKGLASQVDRGLVSRIVNKDNINRVYDA